MLNGAKTDRASRDFTAGKPQNTRVLIVEDSSNDALLVKHALEALGVGDFHFAKTADEAVNILERKACQVACVDYNLPRINGLDLLRVLRSEWPEMRVIMVTGVRNEQVAVEAMKLGALDYISKDDFLTSSLVRSMQAAIRDIQSGRAIALTTESPIDDALVDMEWLLETPATSYAPMSSVESPRERGIFADLIRATELYLTASCEDFPRKATADEESLLTLLVEQGASPREIVLVWRDALRSFRGQALPYNPTLLLANLFKRLLEEYQIQMALNFLDAN